MIGLRQVYSEKEKVGEKKKYKMYSQEKRNTSNHVTAKVCAGRETGIVKEINLLGRGLLCTGPREECSQVKTLSAQLSFHLVKGKGLKNVLFLERTANKNCS